MTLYNLPELTAWGSEVDRLNSSLTLGPKLFSS